MTSILVKELIKNFSISKFNPNIYLNHRFVHGRSLIGNREVVGFGSNGSYNYVDRPDLPFPAIRFREDTPEIKVLREKEKSDWNNLTVEEKKALYRSSFCRTIVEIEAPNGNWKFTFSFTCLLLSLGFTVATLIKVFIIPPFPESTSLENRKKQLRLYLDLKVDPIDGLSSKWDYEKDTWKK